MSTVIVPLALLALAPFPAGANPTVRNTWQGLYPLSLSYSNASCNLCHGGTTSKWNSYGWAIRVGIQMGGKTIQQSILDVAGVNSDADPGGYSNLAEINANTQPGWTPGAVNIIYNGDGTFVTGQNPPVGILGSLDPSSTTTTTSTSSTSSTSTSSTTTSTTATSTSSTTTSSQSSSSTSSTSTSSTTSTSDASATSTTDTTATSTTASSSTTTTLPCGPSPLLSGCRLITVPLKGSLQVKDSADFGKDQVKWKWKLGAATSLGDFKDPVNGSASMQFCVYDNSPSSQPRLSAVLVPGGICGTKPCWKASGTTGYSMTNKVGSPQGLTKAKFMAGSAGKAQVQVQGKGVVLPPLPFTVPVTVQLLIADGFTTQCWQTTFQTFIKNDSLQFKAKGP